MATVPASNTTTDAENAAAPAGKSRKRRSTRHLKLVPETRAMRDTMIAKCREYAATLDKSNPLNKDEMESHARTILEQMNLSEGYVGWTMVSLASEFWRDHIAAIPPQRRLFLMPHCLKNPSGCPADYDEFGLDCRQCGACSIADFRGTAEDMGYKVLVSEGTPIVLKIIVSGHVDAIVGVACLNVLEKAIDKLLLAGIPCMAVPLLSSDCRNTSVDEDLVMDMIKIEHQPPKTQTRTYLHLMRAAANIFEPNKLNQLAPRVRHPEPIPTLDENVKLDPVAGTEILAYDFLAQGGKHFRPFGTLAVYDALTGAEATEHNGQEAAENLPDSVLRTAMSIEVFHKASLVHDDIEDDDQYRYGNETMHRRWGIPTAINVGDYLVGLGYRLVSREAASLGPDVAADILDKLAEAHTRLSEGQGAELMWRDAMDKQLRPLDALKIYALKTAPAFEAALYCGARLAGEVSDYQEKFSNFAKHLGIAFQILNDLKDWNGDEDNKLSAGGDILGGRPTVLWALALEGLPEKDQKTLLEIMSRNPRKPADLPQVRALYLKANVFQKAGRLVDKYQQRAEAIADELEPEALRRLFYYLVDSILDRSGLTIDQPAQNMVSLSMPKSQ
ncbi:Geranylgeranyl pyrophosphate synthase [Planctomycetales bacterium 10988]|nr:Geranylgeranyl pyrophosphate synthase [Planctomycetales bacterium 10988]